MNNVTDIQQPIIITSINVNITRRLQTRWDLEFTINHNLKWTKTVTGKDIDQVIAEEMPILAMALKEAEINSNMS